MSSPPALDSGWEGEIVQGHLPQVALGLCCFTMNARYGCLAHAMKEDSKDKANGWADVSWLQCSDTVQDARTPAAAQGLGAIVAALSPRARPEETRRRPCQRRLRALVGRQSATRQGMRFCVQWETGNVQISFLGAHAAPPIRFAFTSPIIV